MDEVAIRGIRTLIKRQGRRIWITSSESVSRCISDNGEKVSPANHHLNTVSTIIVSLDNMIYITMTNSGNLKTAMCLSFFNFAEGSLAKHSRSLLDNMSVP